MLTYECHNASINVGVSLNESQCVKVSMWVLV